jgi:hypothetical protein
VAAAFVSAATLAANSDPVKAGPKGSPTAPGVARPVVSGSRVAGATFGAHTTTILGTAWNVDNTPIKQATLRLRDVVSGKVAGLSKGNDVGEFAFENIEGGSYVVELLSDTGRIETVGHVFTIASGETVATFVRMEAKVRWGSAFFSNTAKAAAAAAASQGITAITPMPHCVSPPGCSQ